MFQRVTTTDTLADAKDFKKMYKEVHPYNAPAPRLNTPDATSSNAHSVQGTPTPASTRSFKLDEEKADSFLAEWEEEFARNTRN
jgi:hypothetical protein